MYQLLFIIHGMGAGARPTDDPNWWTGVVASMRASAQGQGHQTDFVTTAPKAGQVLVVPLTYHDWFDDTRQKWTQSAGGEAAFVPLLRALLDAAGQNSASMHVPGWATNAGDFFWTHVLDVILYHFIAEFSTPIRDSVATQIATAWHQADINNDARTPVHFVAHSLGTSVLHDSISLLAKEPGFGVGTQHIRTMLTCANVSGILETDFPAYQSADSPIGAPGAAGMTEAYFSFRHELDPIAAVHAFRGDVRGWPANGYRDAIPIDVKDWNVHGFTHYLDNPVVHFPLFQRLWATEPWGERLDPAMQAYRSQQGTACPVAIGRVRTDLRAILADPWPAPNALGLLELASHTMGVLANASNACAGETK